MVLLDKLSKRGKAELIVAHYDHGIREDSKKDRKLVENTAKKLGLRFEYEEGRLGKDASEEQARKARYDFFFKIKDKYQADVIVTAHHQDDALETLIINILRGTGRRGVLKETKDIKRPLLKTSKEEILNYAKAHHIKWREDKTNQDTRYLRNYVRQVLVPGLTQDDPKAIEKLLNSESNLKETNQEIDIEINNVISDNCEISDTSISCPRQWLIMLPNEVGREVIYESCRMLNPDISLDKKNIKYMLVFAKTAKKGKIMEVNKNISMNVEVSKVIIKLV